MAAKKNQDFEIYAGDDDGALFSIVDESGAALDITGATFTWRLANDRYSTSIVAKSGAPALVVISAENGTVALKLTDADTTALVGEYYHALRMTLSGEEAVVAEGTVTVRKG